MSCVICYEEEKSIECKMSKKFLCGECILMHLKSKISVEEISSTFNNKLTSFFCICGDKNCDNLIGLYQMSTTFDENILIKIHEEWIRCNKISIENNTIKEQEKIANAKLEEIKKRKEADIFLYEVEEKTKDIINNIFTPKCPHCKQAFDNFSGCFALKCSRCEYTFCAWCLEFSTIEKPREEEEGYECHNHVAYCRFNIHKGDYFGTIEEFDENMTLRIWEQLNSLIENNANKEAFYLSVFANLKVQLNSYNLFLNDYGFISRKKNANVNANVNANANVNVNPNAGINWMNVNGRWVEEIPIIHPVPNLPRQAPPLLPIPFPLHREENIIPPAPIAKRKRRCSYCRQVGYHDRRTCPVKIEDNL